jgi:glycosyltransferase involved in cell wall biosynthesis
MTGGYIYDARIVDGLRARGRSVGVIDVAATGWPLDWRAGRRMLRALDRHRWAAVVVDELCHPALATAMLSGRLRRALRGAPLVLLVHHLRCSEPAPWSVRSVALTVASLVLRTADRVVCSSETTARTVRRLAGRGLAVGVVRPGRDTVRMAGVVDRGGPAPITSSGDRRGGGGLRVLLVGHWTPRKGVLQAIEALRVLDTNVSLDLVGEQDRDPVYAARVRHALSDPAVAGRVRVHGRISDEQLAALYAEADVLVLPSTHEGYGMVLAEALEAGLPIVATRVGAVPEVVRDALEAELVPPDDVGALARALARLAADPGERVRRSRLARERAGALPRWSESIAAFEDELHSALVRTPSGS